MVTLKQTRHAPFQLQRSTKKCCYIPEETVHWIYLPNLLSVGAGGRYKRWRTVPLWADLVIEKLFKFVLRPLILPVFTVRNAKIAFKTLNLLQFLTGFPSSKRAIKCGPSVQIQGKKILKRSQWLPEGIERKEETFSSSTPSAFSQAHLGDQTCLCPRALQQNPCSSLDMQALLWLLTMYRPFSSQLVKPLTNKFLGQNSYLILGTSQKWVAPYHYTSSDLHGAQYSR